MLNSWVTSMFKSIKMAILTGVLTASYVASASAAITTGCELFGNLKSVDSGIPITIEITNVTENYRGVLWLDYQGHPVDYQGLNGRQSYTQQTFVGHPWMFTNGPGDCMQITIPQEDTIQIEIKN